MSDYDEDDFAGDDFAGDTFNNPIQIRQTSSEFHEQPQPHQNDHQNYHQNDHQNDHQQPEMHQPHQKYPVIEMKDSHLETDISLGNVLNPNDHYYDSTKKQLHKDDGLKVCDEDNLQEVMEDGEIDCDDDDNIDPSLFLNERLGFIRKVYGILVAMLLLTVAICFVAMVSTAYQSFVKAYYWTFIIAIIINLFIAILLVCNRELARTVPHNYCCLFFFTLSEAYMVSCIIFEYPARNVLIAAFMTCCVTIGLTLYAFTTKRDFTLMGGWLFIASFALIGVGIVSICTRSFVIYQVYCFIGVILYGMYLVYDTQLVVGKGRLRYSSDDYIVAALQIYLDIILIFLKLLQAMGNK